MFQESDPQEILKKILGLQNMLKTAEICFGTNPIEYQATEENQTKIFHAKMNEMTAGFFMNQKNFERAEREVNNGIKLAEELLLR